MISPKSGMMCTNKRLEGKWGWEVESWSPEGMQDGQQLLELTAPTKGEIVEQY